MLAIAKLTVGDGYEYLSRQVATGDIEMSRSQALAAYYAASGTEQGVWLGRGLEGLADVRRGDPVTREAMTRLFRDGRDPSTGDALGIPFDALHVGRGKPVAGFDLVFTVPKSASVLWALGDAATREAVVGAHRSARAQALTFLEDKAIRTRVGAGGSRQVRTLGVVAAGFEHVDSRLNDPNLHTHLVIANKVQTPDGTWRALDGRTLLQATVSASELYDGFLADELSRRLGVRWELRDRGPRRNPTLALQGLSDEVLDLFSRRGAQVDAAQQAWETTFVLKHGRTPDPVEVTKARGLLTRSTRPAKVLRPLGELFEEWANRARALTGLEPRDLAARALVGDYGRSLHVHDVAGPMRAALVDQVLADVQGRAAVFSTWTLTAAAARATRVLPMASPDERIALVGTLVTAAAGCCVRLDDGQVRRIGEEKFTTPAILAAEQELLNRAMAPTGLGVPHPVQIARQLARYPGLSEDQRRAAAAVLGSGQVIDTVVGPAGSGKTTTLRAVIGAWQSVYGSSVIALAPSATAAHVLGEALGIRAETTAKWLFEQPRNDERAAEARELAARLPLTPTEASDQLEARIVDLMSQVQAWRLSRGQLVVLDEASLADTPTLATLAGQAQDAGAKIVLVGDPEQRPAVGPGGGFGMLVHRHATAQLTALHRFTQPWEAAAVLQIRAGDARAIAVYRSQGRITVGAPDEVLDTAVLAAGQDAVAGKVVLLQAADTRTVHELNARAHAAAVLDGRARRDGGVPLADQTVATVGDRVVTRHNDRRLRTTDGFVRNGALWDVTATAPDGSLTVRPADHRDQPGADVRLPAGYVREHVELGYATTTARSQGRTVDTTHTVVSAAMAREDLYVAVTRGRDHNQLYVPTGPFDADCPPGPSRRQEADETLRTVLATNRIPATATETWAANHPGEPVPVPSRVPTWRPEPVVVGGAERRPVQPRRAAPPAALPPPPVRPAHALDRSLGR
ncbi:MobF family relaxase [Cellulomonas sp. NTE-D12]|uniref:MobF family relaxase n=1 Tax=Cellulomonas sp. NTE-D12 TaxID=2962632 RepID=UPI0030814997|nr:hypothetical protein CELD12_01360 [Cellulomonas sp. NTE-D12]